MTAKPMTANDACSINDSTANDVRSTNDGAANDN